MSDTPIIIYLFCFLYKKYKNDIDIISAKILGKNMTPCIISISKGQNRHIKTESIIDNKSLTIINAIDLYVFLL